MAEEPRRSPASTSGAFPNSALTTTGTSPARCRSRRPPVARGLGALRRHQRDVRAGRDALAQLRLERPAHPAGPRAYGEPGQAHGEGLPGQPLLAAGGPAGDHRRTHPQRRDRAATHPGPLRGDARGDGHGGVWVPRAAPTSWWRPGEARRGERGGDKDREPVERVERGGPSHAERFTRRTSSSPTWTPTDSSPCCLPRNPRRGRG
jgi:hypothetical protein